jgi:hypothetical protein
MGAVAHDMTQVGWREWFALPDLGLPLIKAKIDTGARSSSLHVESWELVDRHDHRWVAFVLRPGSRRGRAKRIEAPVLDTREVTDSSGNRALRPFILTTVMLGSRAWPVEINLTNRQSMLFPLLIGRTAMARRLVVDPSRSFVLGRPQKRKART